MRENLLHAKVSRLGNLEVKPPFEIGLKPPILIKFITRSNVHNWSEDSLCYWGYDTLSSSQDPMFITT